MEVDRESGELSSNEPGNRNKFVRILYVERGLDVKLCATILQSSTSILSFTCIFDVYSDGLDALDAIRRSNFDIVFLADNLRPLRHIDVIRVINNISYNTNVVIVKTDPTFSNVDGNDQVFLLKPFSSADLCSVITKRLYTRVSIEQLMVSLLSSEDFTTATNEVVLSNSVNSYVQEQIASIDNEMKPTQRAISKPKKSGYKKKSTAASRRSLIPIVPKYQQSSITTAAGDSFQHVAFTDMHRQSDDNDELEDMQVHSPNNGWPSIFSSMSPNQLFGLDLGSPIHDTRDNAGLKK